MNRPTRLFLLVLLVTPALTYLVHRVAKGLGYLDPPASKEHEYRRTVSAALYAFLLFLPVFLYGWEKGWPRIWAVFGVVNGLVLLVFAATGVVNGVRLWKLRHPQEIAVPSAGAGPLAGHSPVLDLDVRGNPPENPS